MEALLTIGAAALFVSSDRIEVNGKPVHLTPHQERLFRLLWKRRPMPVRKEDLAEALDSHAASVKIVDSQICLIRSALKQAHGDLANLIETRYGVGYRILTLSPGADLYSFRKGGHTLALRWHGDLVVDGNIVHVPPHELNIFKVLAQHPGQVCTKDLLFDALYGADPRPDQKIFDVMVCKLRKRIAGDDENDDPGFIDTIWGRGYMLVDETVAATGDTPLRLAASVMMKVGGIPQRVHELPAANCRWVPSRKEMLVQALELGAVTMEALLRHYPDLTEGEIRSWARNIKELGRTGLKLTRFHHLPLAA